MNASALGSTFFGSSLFHVGNFRIAVSGLNHDNIRHESRRRVGR